MRALLQRVKSSLVRVGGEVVGEIGEGLLAFVGFKTGDTSLSLPLLASKVANLRLFSDETGRPNRSLLDVEGELLIVSQFTLYAETAKGRRPDYALALERTQAEELYNAFILECRKLPIKRIETGLFGADMLVSLENDGPVTVMVEL